MPFYEVVAYARIQAQSAAPTFTELGHIFVTAGSQGQATESGGLSWSKELYSDGSISVSTLPEVLNDDIGDNLRDMANNPMEIGVFRDGVLVQRGPLIAWQVEGETLVLHARGLSYYLRYMFVTSDLTLSKDQAFIVQDLIDHHQDKDYGDFGLDASGITSHSQNRAREYKAGEQVNIYEEIRDLAEIDNGFDMVVDPVDRDVDLFNPTKGSVKAASILDNRVVTSPNMSDVVTAGRFGSSAFAAGVDSGGALQTAIITNTSVRNNFGLAYVARAVPGIDSVADLTNIATRIRDIVSDELFTPNKKYGSATGVSVDDFDIGDTVTFDYNAGFGRLVYAKRVKNIFVSVTGGNLETLTLDFV